MKPSEDHRTTTGRLRSEQMRLRLMEAGLRQVAEQGAAALSIDGVTSRAAVARGSFYKHFDRPEALFSAIGLELSEDIIRLVNPILRQIPDPATRLAIGVRMILGMVRQSPLVGLFIARAGWPDVPESHLFHVLAGPSIGEGLTTGRFTPISMRLLSSLVIGPMIGCMFDMAKGLINAQDEEQLAAGMLRALGIPPDEAMALAGHMVALPAPPETGLLARLQLTK